MSSQTGFSPRLSDGTSAAGLRDLRLGLRDCCLLLGEYLLEFRHSQFHQQLLFGYPVADIHVGFANIGGQLGEK